MLDHGIGGVRETSETSGETGPPVRAVDVSQESYTPEPPTAEQKMWAYYQDECAKGRTPTGAELDRIVGTNNYGRRVLRRWGNAVPSQRQIANDPPGQNR